MFLDDLMEWLSEQMLQDKNIILAGYFNIHVNNLQNNDEAFIFHNTMVVLGLEQHCTFPTHNSDNTLDLLFTEACSNIRVQKWKPGPFFSDHSMDTELLVNLMNLQDLDKITNLNDLVSSFNSRSRTTLDQMAPIMTNSITIRNKNP